MIEGLLYLLLCASYGWFCTPFDCLSYPKFLTWLNWTVTTYNFDGLTAKTWHIGSRLLHALTRDRFTRTASAQTSSSLTINRWHNNLQVHIEPAPPALKQLISRSKFSDYECVQEFPITLLLSWGGIPPSVVPVWRSAENQTDLHPVARIKGIGEDFC